jgi:magnesium-transporting ATPase (P-type)
MLEKKWHSLELESIENFLETDLKNGLSEEDAILRLKSNGKNSVFKEERLSGVKIFLNQFKNPLIYILIAAGVLTLIMGDFTDSAVIFGAVLLNTIFGFFQENKTSKIVSELKKIVKIKAFVKRSGKEKEIEREFIAPGDVFLLKSGDKVPADGRIIKSQNFKIDESLLTGEWFPASKEEIILPQKTILADRDNMVYMGTVVEEGRAEAVAVGTGLESELGKIAKGAKEIKEEKTPYQKKITIICNINRFFDFYFRGS